MSEIEQLAVHTGTVDVPPAEVGYDEEAIRRLDAHLQGLVRENKLQGASYLLARYGKVFACKSMGRLTHHQGSSDLLTDSLWCIASITKLFTAMAIMTLVESGRLYLGKPIAEIIPEFGTDTHRKITIFHLLTHTAGLMPDPGYFLEPYPRGWWVALMAQEAPGYPEDQKIGWIKAALSGAMHCKPGEKWGYCSAGFLILGEIISRVTDMPCEQYIDDRIIKPLGLKNTFFDVPHDLQENVCFTNDWAERELKKREKGAGRPPGTAGGLYSSLADLNTFAQMTLKNGLSNGTRIVSRKTIEYMTKNHLRGVPAFHWGAEIKDHRHGLGFAIYQTDLVSPNTYIHEGAGRSALQIDPDEELVSVINVPSTVDWLPESIIGTHSVIWSGLL